MLALYNSRLTSGIVVTVGHNVASVSPVWRGQLLTQFVYFLESDTEDQPEAKDGMAADAKEGARGKVKHVLKKYHYNHQAELKKGKEWEKKFMAMDWGEIVADAIRHASEGDTKKQQTWRQAILLSGGTPHHTTPHHTTSHHTTPHHITITPQHNTTQHNATLANTRWLGKSNTPGFEEKLNQNLRKKFGEGTPFKVIAPVERVYDVVLGGVVINGLFQSKRNELANNTETNIKAEASGHHGWASPTLKDYYASGKPSYSIYFS